MSRITRFDQVRGRIADDLRRAMKARQRVRVAALRRALNTLDNATAVDPAAPDSRMGRAPGAEAPRRTVSIREIEGLLLSQAQECAAAALAYRRLDEAERADRLSEEAGIIRACLEHLDASGP